jgi:hypothetical protein
MGGGGPGKSVGSNAQSSGNQACPPSTQAAGEDVQDSASPMCIVKKAALQARPVNRAWTGPGRRCQRVTQAEQTIARVAQREWRRPLSIQERQRVLHAP